MFPLCYDAPFIDQNFCLICLRPNIPSKVNALTRSRSDRSLLSIWFGFVCLFVFECYHFEHNTSIWMMESNQSTYIIKCLAASQPRPVPFTANINKKKHRNVKLAKFEYRKSNYNFSAISRIVYFGLSAAMVTCCFLYHWNFCAGTECTVATSKM